MTLVLPSIIVVHVNTETFKNGKTEKNSLRTRESEKKVNIFKIKVFRVYVKTSFERSTRSMENITVTVTKAIRIR